MSSPDLESFHIDDCEASPKKVESPMAISVPTPNRKRGRSSVDLQQNIRHLLNRSSSYHYSEPTVLPDRTVARSFMLGAEFGYERKGLQSPKHTVPERRLPIQKDFGKKRTCCGTEAAQVFYREGPGMWEGVL